MNLKSVHQIHKFFIESQLRKNLYDANGVYVPKAQRSGQVCAAQSANIVSKKEEHAGG
jgi:hypothetical protein